MKCTLKHFHAVVFDCVYIACYPGDFDMGNHDPEISIVVQRLSEFVTSHAMLSTSSFTSQLCLQDNNLFSTRVPKFRKSHLIAGISTHPTGYPSIRFCKYLCLQDSIYDLFSVFEYCKISVSKIHTLRQYAERLQSIGHFSTSLNVFLVLIHRYHKQLKNELQISVS